MKYKYFKPQKTSLQKNTTCHDAKWGGVGWGGGVGVGGRHGVPTHSLICDLGGLRIE
jgi:hypothetical protein